MLSHYTERGGGAEAHVFDLVDAMREGGMEVVTAALPAGVGGRLQVSSPDRVGASQAAPNGRASSDISQVLKDFSPDVIHVHNDLDRALLQLLRSQAPVVQSVHNHTTCSHGHRYFGPGQECHHRHGPACVVNSILRNCGHTRVPSVPIDKYRRTNERLDGLRRVDGVIAYSEYVAADLRANEVPNVGVHRLFVHDRKPAAPTSSHGRQILFAGRVVPEKGLNVLLRALARVDATLEVFGDGWDLGRSRRLCARLAVTDRVRFAGWGSKAELDDAYRRCALVAVPSVWPEPFGLVGIEAMIYGKPVIASATGGIPEWLTDQVNGHLVRAGDPDALAAGLNRMLDDPVGMREMGQRGRAIALDHYTVEQHLRGLSSSYAQARRRWELDQ